MRCVTAVQPAQGALPIQQCVLHHCRAEVVDGQVQVVGPSAAGQNADGSASQEPPKEDFEVPSQLRQQFIEVQDCTSNAIDSAPVTGSSVNTGLSLNHHNMVPALSQARPHGGRKHTCSIELAVVQIGMPQHYQRLNSPQCRLYRSALMTGRP